MDTEGWIVTIGLLLIIILTILLADGTINDLNAEIHCGNGDLKYIPVYNETANSAIKFQIGSKCCQKIKETTFNNQTGDWTTEKYEECFYVPREDD